uniref:RUN domain-containing protein 1 n=1 Tax=Cacopsylla melanoneura TaxID=428564 RepID=A0A8D8ZZS0_9HEMI
MDTETKSTIDKVFEDLDEESDTEKVPRTNCGNSTNLGTTESLPNASNTQMIDLENDHSNEFIPNTHHTQIIETNGRNSALKGINMASDIIDNTAHLNAIKTLDEPNNAITEGPKKWTNDHSTTNLMEHIEVVRKQESSMKTKDGIDLADLLEDLCNDGQPNATKVNISSVPDNLLDMNDTSEAISNKSMSTQICRTDAVKTEVSLAVNNTNIVPQISNTNVVTNANISASKPDPLMGDINFGVISKTDTEADRLKSDTNLASLTNGRKISSQLTASFNLHDPNPTISHRNDFPSDFGFDCAMLPSSLASISTGHGQSMSRQQEGLLPSPSTSKGREELSPFDEITSRANGKDAVLKFDGVNIESSIQLNLSERSPNKELSFASTSKRQDCMPQFNEGILETSSQQCNPPDRSPQKDFFLSERSPRKEFSRLHSLESDGNMFDGRQYISYDDGLTESSNHYHQNLDSLTETHHYQNANSSTESHHYRHNLDYSSGDFSNVSGLHESDLLSKYKEMEAQQELLNHSLISLSTHFAQVQLRLKQIINSPKNEQETLLKNLEKFTFIGIPEVNELCLYNYETKSHDDESTETAECKSYIEDKLAFEKNKHKEMIGKLKTQLESLENYVYEFSNNDDAEIPTSLIINKQQIIINELKDKLNLNVNLSEDEQLREEINKSIIGPMKTKEDLILQLKTQISDLEKFINFLQSNQCKCTVAASNVDMKQKTITIMKKISTILHIFAEHHSSNFKKPATVASMKKSMKVNHYGDLRAQLEIAINHVIDACRQPPDQDIPIDSDYMSDTEDPIPCNSKVALAVRKHLAPTLQRLLQHGLCSPNANQTVSVVQYISCASSVNKRASTAHIWDLINKYYEIKDGADFNCKPNRKLSESFNLDIGAGTLGIKQSLLASIGNILAVHHKYKKFNPDSYFKSFVCDGLNKKLLVDWLHLILAYKSFSTDYYAPWSYVSSTRFVDAAASLRRLYEFHFSLTIVDVAIRNLQSIKDAF